MRRQQGSAAQASCYSVSSLKYWSYTSVCNVSARESGANEQIIVNSDVKPLYFDMVVWISCCNLWMSWDKKNLNTSHVCWVHRLASEFGKLFFCIKSESNRAWLLEYFTYLLSETGTMHGTKQCWHFDRHCFGLYANLAKTLFWASGILQRPGTKQNAYLI
jgi:hypothetical protein